MSTDSIKKWAENGTELAAISWENLPDIQLYMDQVISILTDKLDFFLEDNKITGSMINNYVKAEVVSHPEKKKYTKEQLSQFIIVCLLKNVLSIPDIKTLLENCKDSKDFFEYFQSVHTEAVNDVSSQLRFSMENENDLKKLALRLAAEANAKRAAAESILKGLGNQNTTKIKQKK